MAMEEDDNDAAEDDAKADTVDGNDWNHTACCQNCRRNYGCSRRMKSALDKRCLTLVHDELLKNHLMLFKQWKVENINEYNK